MSTFHSPFRLVIPAALASPHCDPLSVSAEPDPLDESWAFGDGFYKDYEDLDPDADVGVIEMPYQASSFTNPGPFPLLPLPDRWCCWACSARPCAHPTHVRKFWLEEGGQVRGHGSGLSVQAQMAAHSTWTRER